MSSVGKITISLPTSMLADIKAAVEAGEFANTSEAVREAVRHWRRSRTVIALNDAELRKLVAEGRRSGEPIDADVVLDRLHAKYTAMAATRKR